MTHLYARRDAFIRDITHSANPQNDVAHVFVNCRIHTRDIIFSYLYQHQQIASSFQPGVQYIEKGRNGWKVGGGQHVLYCVCV